MNRFLPMIPMFLLALALCAPVWADGDGWLEDFELARKKAQEEGKDLLIDFTGSDWCGWCVRLDEEVFSQDVFQERAPEKYVLVVLDFPRGKPQSDQIKAQNEKLQMEFEIEGFPTIYLADAEGRPYARTGYMEGGPLKYLEHLEELQENKTRRDELMGQAESADGIEKARMLDGVLSFLAEQEVATGPYQALVEQIISLDAGNEAGLKAKYEMGQKLGQIETLLSNGDFDGVIEAATTLGEAEGTPAELRQKAYYLQAIARHNKEDAEGTLESLRTALDADPESELADQIRAILSDLEGK